MYYSKIRILNRYYTAVYMVQVIVHSAIQPKTYKYNWLKSIGHLPVVFLNSCLSYTNFFTMLLHLAFLTVHYYERAIAKGIAFLTWSNTSCITFICTIRLILQHTINERIMPCTYLHESRLTNI